MTTRGSFASGQPSNAWHTTFFNTSLHSFRGASSRLSLLEYTRTEYWPLSFSSYFSNSLSLHHSIPNTNFFYSSGSESVVLEVGGGQTCLAGVALACSTACAQVLLTDGNERAVQSMGIVSILLYSRALDILIVFVDCYLCSKMRILCIVQFTYS